MRTAPATPAETAAGLTALWADFADLTPERLHAVFRLRVDVFVVEQACAYAEVDGRDPTARHLLLEARDGSLAAYLRLLHPEAAGAPARLGRIVIAPTWRGRRLGGVLMRAGIEEAGRLHPDRAIELSAQAHLEKFYRAHGFETVSGTYLEDGIPHIDMRRPAGPVPAAAIQHGSPSS